MRGQLLLEGGSEFGGQIAEPDRRAMALAGGVDIPICIIPAAAAPDNNHQRAGQNGVRWFQHLGARQVASIPLIDARSANQTSIAATLEAARLIYLLGGFPRYLEQTLAHSLCWQAILAAYTAGAVVGGSSAGAMVLCQHYYDPEAHQVREGLNLLPRTCLIPHHNTSGKGWATFLVAELPADMIIGIDESTGIIDDGADGSWTIYGRGEVTCYQNGQARIYRAHDRLFF